MKFEINRLEMLNAAKSAAKVVPVRAPVDILNSILIESDDDTSEIFLTATNFEVSIQLKVKADVEERGSMLVNPKILVGMLTLLSGDTVTFSAATHDTLKVTAGKSVYELKCLLAQHYPKPIMPFPEDTAKVSGICSIARRTVFSVSKEDHNPALQCVSVKLMKNTLHAAACDGMRMILIKGDSKSTDCQEFLLPGHSLWTLASISDEDDIYDVADTGTEVVFVKKSMMFTIRKITGSFIDTTALIKSINPVYAAVADAREMRKALDLITVGTKGQPVNFIMLSGSIILNGECEGGEVQVAVAAMVFAETPETGFYYNAEKLYALFQVVDGNAKLEIDARGTLLVKTVTEVYLQLPILKRSAKDKKKSEAA